METIRANPAWARKIICGLVALLVVGCTMPTTQSSMPKLSGDAIRIESAMSRPAPGGGNGAAYFSIVNPTDAADRLITAQSASAKVTELHETIEDNGIMRMVPHPEGFEIPARSIVALKPGGKHLMLLDLIEPLDAGDEITLTLNFENAGVLDLTVPVMQMTESNMSSMSNHPVP